MISTLEIVGDYVAKGVSKLQRDRYKSTTVRSRAVDDFTEYADKYHSRTVFSQNCAGESYGGCFERQSQEADPALLMPFLRSLPVAIIAMFAMLASHVLLVRSFMARVARDRYPSKRPCASRRVGVYAFLLLVLRVRNFTSLHVVLVRHFGIVSE